MIAVRKPSHRVDDDEMRPLDVARMIALIRRLRKLSEVDDELASLLSELAPQLPARSVAHDGSRRARTTSQNEETIFAAGQHAFEHGDQQSTCPYGDGEAARAVWQAGWDEAKRFAEWAKSRRDGVRSNGHGGRS